MPDATCSDADTTKKPTMPSTGGLLAKQFIYRTAEKTDVRLTWERARKTQQAVITPANTSLATAT